MSLHLLILLTRKWVEAVRWTVFIFIGRIERRLTLQPSLCVIWRNKLAGMRGLEPNGYEI